MKVFLRITEKETPTQVFSCEYCENFKSTHFEEHLRTDFSKPNSISLNLRCAEDPYQIFMMKYQIILLKNS